MQKKENKKKTENQENTTLILNIINFCVSEIQIENGKSVNCIIQENYNWNPNVLTDRSVKIFESEHEVKCFRYLCNFLFYKDEIIYVFTSTEITILNFKSNKKLGIKSMTFKIEAPYDTILLKGSEYLILSLGQSIDGIVHIFKF